MKTTTRKVRFEGGCGHELDGRIELPDGQVRHYALFCHCFTCTKETLAAFRVSRQLAMRGIAVLRFDFTGLGGSDGEFADTNFSTHVEDIHAAARFMDSHLGRPELFIGHSLGGTAALQAALAARPAGVVTIAAPSQPTHILHHFGEALYELEGGKSSRIAVAGKSYPVKPHLVRDLRQYDMRINLVNLDSPVLIFSIINDALVSARNANDLETWISGKTTLVQLADADHVLSGNRNSEIIADTIVEWFK